MYRERPSRIGGSVVWHRDAGAAGVVRVLPDGCIDLIASDDGRLFVAGPDTVAQLYHGAGEALDAIRLGPGLAPSLLGLPAIELRDRRVALADVWGDALARDVAEVLAEAPDRLAALESLAEHRLRAAPMPPIPPSSWWSGSCGVADGWPTPPMTSGSAHGSSIAVPSPRSDTARRPSRGSCASSARWREPGPIARSPTSPR